jgi:Xaa-Pro aminopeptidase
VRHANGAGEFAKRRAAFVEKIGDAVAIFPSAPEAVRSNDTRYPYRQDTDLYYLSGFEEPESVLVLAPKHPKTKTVMFVRPRDPEKETWDGRRFGVEGAVADFGVDAAYPIAELDQRLPELLETAGTLYYAFDRDGAFNRRIVELLQRYRVSRRRSDGGPLTIVDPSVVLHELRIFKSAADIEGMRRAVAISREGHIAAMRYARPGMHEYEIQAIVEYVFTSRGAQSAAYTSIVGAGVNGTVLHYHENRARVRDNDLLLIDAGAEVDYYCGDLTRTWPISGKFSPEQRAVYDIVLAAQLRCIDMCKPGVNFSADVNDMAVRIITEGLIDLKLLSGALDENIEKANYRRFYMHRIGHYLGMDTHDVGSYRENGDWRRLRSGAVVTIEPGIYIPEDADIPAGLRGIGVRIEDNILITENGSDNLSAGTPKTVEEIEREIAQGRESKVPLLA